MSEQFDVFTFDEMRRVSCTCEKCGTEIVFDLSHTQTFANKCPGCDSALYPMSEILDGVRGARTKASEAKLNVRFLAPAPKGN
jgi:hypothetical protein